MAFDYQRFCEILSSTPQRPNTEERIFLHETAKILILSFENLTQDNRQVLLSNLHEFERHLGPYKTCFINSLLYGLTQKKKYLEKALKLLERLPVFAEDSINDFWALTLLEQGAQTSKGQKKRRALLKRLFSNSMQAMSTQYEQIVSAGSGKRVFEPNNRVVIITGQLLAVQHAPTEIALNYAHILRKDYNKDVLVVNSCEYSAHPSGAFATSKSANVMENYSNFSSLSFEGQTFGLFQPTPAKCSDDGLAACIKKIDAFDPALIIVIGNSSSIAEAFLPRSFVMYSPTANEVPYTINANFHMHDEPSSELLALMEQENIHDKYTFFLPGGYTNRQKFSTLTKEELGLPENRPIAAIVGNRLTQEVTDSFLDMLDHISTASDCFFLFLGDLKTYSDLKKSRPAVTESSTHLAYHRDIMAVYEHCDFYINPKRKGGGTSAVYAMQSGLPVLSLPYGDVSFTASNFPTIEDYSGLADIAIKLSNEPDFLKKYQAFAQEGCDAVNGLSGIIAKILEHYENHVTAHQEQDSLAS